MTGVHVTLTLTRRQADAVLAAKLTVGYGRRPSVPLVEGERRLMDAIRKALSQADDPTPEGVR